jgi:hypothetical protein
VIWFPTMIAGCSNLAIWNTERPSEAGASSSVGSHGDSHDSALAECVNGHWRSLEQVELATQNGSIGGTTNASTAPSEPPAGRIFRLTTIEHTRRAKPRDSKPLSQ